MQLIAAELSPPPPIAVLSCPFLQAQQKIRPLPYIAIQQTYLYNKGGDRIGRLETSGPYWRRGDVLCMYIVGWQAGRGGEEEGNDEGYTNKVLSTMMMRRRQMSSASLHL